MERIVDLIRSSQVPSNMMQFAARGALSVPPSETIEILVHLALHNKVFGEQARMTLAGWDEKASRAVAADANTSAEVLKYLVSRENLRISLLSALADNPSVDEDSLDELAVSGSRAVVEALLASQRVIKSRRLLEALQSNPILRRNELAEIERELTGAERAREGQSSNSSSNSSSDARVAVASVEMSDAEAGDMLAAEVEGSDPLVESTVTKYLEENAAELEAENDRPFQPLGLANEETALVIESRASFSAGTGEPSAPVQLPENAIQDGGQELEAQISSAQSGNGDATNRDAPGGGAPTAGAPIAGDSKPVLASAGKPAVTTKPKKPSTPVADRRDSTLQKISKLDIRGRISLAMRGNKEDRSILIRDSTKLVAVAVLESPKITDGEVEAFALQKNVLESVLRAIPMKRRFAKNYSIMRNLVQNPRTPLDLSLGLMKNLLIRDLKNLSGNKEVADTIRKVALRMYKQKMEKKD